MSSSDQDNSLVDLFQPGWWKPWALIFMMGVGGSGILGLWVLLGMYHWGPIIKRLPQEEHAALNFIMFLDLGSVMMTGICHVGIPAARLLKLTADADQLRKFKAFMSTLFGLPAGALLLYFSFGTVVGSSLGSVEIGLMVAMGFVLLVGGAYDAVTTWRHRRPL